MDYPFEVFRQDVEVAENALNEEDFRTLNIISNRIMSNAIFGTERKFAITGFVLKEISMLLAEIKANAKTKPYSTALALTKEYVKKLLKDTDSPKFVEDTLWVAYAKFLDEIRIYEMPEFEAKTYKKNYQFTRNVYSQLLSYLRDNKDKLTNSRNRILNGILNEMVRTHRCHGGELPEVYMASVTYLLTWCDQYPKGVASSPEEYERMIKETILPFVERATKVLVEPINSDDVNQLAWELIRIWRYYFINFMDLAGTVIEVSQQPTKSLPLPEETKKKLTTAITKSLEEEIKTKAK